ncbi:MAG: LytR family transcriptional regulator [Chloroflexi bacterium]|nr:LytR family transcriptional regulator [Chloroflexota bacterium]
MRTALAGLLGLIVPGAGHALLGRRRAAVLFLAPIVLVVGLFASLYVSGGYVAVLAFVVTPGVLPALAVLNVALAAWRIAAAVDAARGTKEPRLAAGVLGPAVLVLVLVPHLWIGSTIAATNDFLDSTFASGPEATDAPWTPEPEPTDPPDPWWANLPNDPYSPDPLVTLPPEPSKGPRGTFVAGVGNLPGLNAAVPWDRPGAVPWGDDGRFDLLLLGSDASGGRWSRRMDTMLLVEIDVATGKVAMIGLPRNLVNAPFPPGPARNAVACGCFRDLLNALYVEATFRHPERWPGTGAVEGIGAVRAVVSELTGRPIDAVLVADLWGVIKVVDAMGGLDIYIPSTVHDEHYPDPVLGRIELTIKAGKQHLDGRLTLAYARTRHQDSDYSRMARQQTVLLAIRDQIGPATILNAPGLFKAAKGFAWTDLPRSSLPNLVELFGKAANASVKQLRIVPPKYPSWLTPAIITKIRKDVAAMLGVPPPPEPSPTPVPSFEPTPSVEPSTGPSPSPSPAPSAAPSETPGSSPTSSSSPTPSSSQSAQPS